MSKNAVTGIDDENDIREVLKHAGIQAFRKMAGYKPKVLDVDKIPPIVASPYNTVYENSPNNPQIIFYVKMCYDCCYATHLFLDRFYGGIEKNPYDFHMLNFDFVCVNCGKLEDGIPF
jgi:hypothetical protein